MLITDLHKEDIIIWKTRKWEVVHINLEVGNVRLKLLAGEKPLYRDGKSSGNRLKTFLTKKVEDFQAFSE